MQFRAVYVCLFGITCLLACGKGPGKALTGEWVGEDSKSKTKSVLELSADGAYSFLAANDFAAGLQKGRYSQTPDHLELTADAPVAGRMTFAYRWVAANRIALKPDIGGATETIYELKGPARFTTASSPAVLQAARSSAELTTCLSNMKQVGTAMLIYTQDFDNTLPLASSWAPSLFPYTKFETVFTCPTLRKANEQGGYAMDSRLDQTKMTAIADPRSMVLLFESSTKQVGAADAQASLLTKARHADRVGIAFADGSVRSFEKK